MGYIASWSIRTPWNPMSFSSAAAEMQRSRDRRTISVKTVNQGTHSMRKTNNKAILAARNLYEH